MKNLDLSSKVVVVTGAMGQMGQYLVRDLLQQGARVVGLDVTDKPHKDFFKGLEVYENPKLARFFKADVTDQDSLKEINQQVEKEMGPIFGLINNAAIDFPPSSKTPPLFEDTELELLKKVLDVNILGSIVPCMVFGKAMKAHNAGSIINIASVYGMRSPDQHIYEYKRKEGDEWYKPSSYSISKSALYNLTRYLAVYWGKSQVRVNTISPAGIFNHQDQEFLDAYLPKIPLGRMAEPDDIVNTACFLLSDLSQYMTGQNLVVDGGYTAK